ncbi:MAG: hypothetical protein J6X03_05315, partial [Bacilli bacterium]|nr:hypothetical protein [Bacilli bacterium]
YKKYDYSEIIANKRKKVSSLPFMDFNDCIVKNIEVKGEQLYITYNYYPNQITVNFNINELATSTNEQIQVSTL